jgi:pyruvate,orthophosphate dikinase
VVGCGKGTIGALVGKIVTVDGMSGIIYEGAVGVTASSPDPYLKEFSTYVQWPVEPGHPLAALAHLAPTAQVRS